MTTIKNKTDLKAMQARGEELTPDQVNIINNETYPDDYELTPWEALTEQGQEDKFIADAAKWGEGLEKRAKQTYYK